jgi:uncharacterized protein YkwD
MTGLWSRIPDRLERLLVTLRWIVSVVLVVALVSVGLVTVGVQTDTIDLDPDPVTDAPANTTGVPDVEASNHTQIDGEALEMAIYQEVNERRQNAGREPLVHSERVRLIARLHSKDMAKRDYFDHTNPDGEGSAERHDNYDGCENTNENIAYITSAQNLTVREISETVVNMWSESPGHNKSMLTSYDKVTGVGVYVTAERELYVTQNFCWEHPNA